MVIKGPTMTLKDSTTMENIRDFLHDNNINPNAKLAGKYNPASNETILYIKQSTIFKNPFSNKSTERKENVKTAFMNLANKQVDEAVKKMKTMTPEDKSRLENLAGALKGRSNQIGDKSIKAGQLFVLAGLVDGTRALGKDKVEPDGPKRNSMSGFKSTVLDYASKVSDAISNKASVDTLGQEFGTKLAAKFMAQNTSPEKRMDFATSNGEALKQSLMREMTKGMSPDDAKAFRDSPDSQRFLDIAYNTAASKMLGNSEVPNESVKLKVAGKDVDVPKIIINGVKYEPVAHLGTGGFAEVYEYKSMDGKNTSIAYKISHNMSPTGDLAGNNDSIKSVGDEIRSHIKVVGKGHDNVLNIVGAVRTPDGRLGIAMEKALKPNGLELAADIKNAIGTGPGKISQELADVIRLTFIKDSARGLGYMQEKREVMHLDFKSPNILLSPDGKAKISDYGMSKSGTEQKLRTTPVPQTPTWVAPEVLASKNEMTRVTGFEDVSISGKKDKVLNLITQGFEGLNKKQINNMLRNIFGPLVGNLIDDLKINNKVDSWGMGIVALDMFGGKPQFTNFSASLYNTNVGDHLEAFYNDPSMVAVSDKTDASQLTKKELFASTGNKELDKLLNRTLLNRDPDKRGTMSDFIKDPLFKQPGVGSKESRELLAAIASGDPDKIDKAAAKLSKKVGV